MTFYRKYLNGALWFTLFAALLLSACSPSAPALGPASVPVTGAEIRIGSKDFTEQFIVAEMYAQLLESNGFKVTRRFNLGGTPVAHAAILAGDIDLYPEYTSTGLLTVLKEPLLRDPLKIYQAVKDGYEQNYQLTWLTPSPFNNTQALAITRETADRLGIRTFSDLSAKAPELVLGGPAEFLEREDGLKDLQNYYGGFQFKSVRQLGAGSLRYQALLDGEIDVVVAFGTDGQIQGHNLALLQDDLHIFPIYNIAPVTSLETLGLYPQIATILDPLAPHLTDAVMSRLNWEVDGPQKREPAAVARDFLIEAGLLTVTP